MGPLALLQVVWALAVEFGSSSAVENVWGGRWGRWCWTGGLWGRMGDCGLMSSCEGRLMKDLLGE